ncbi:MAG: hypothetical protein KKG04_07620, partial [Candidatus Thermoplasmatota archaeon]|nr:hypothetical protein [Candidatus Thermoplasmatota archaeon]
FIPGKNLYNRQRYLAIRIFTANLITIGKSRNPLFLIFFIIEDFYIPKKSKLLYITSHTYIRISEVT